MRLSTLALLFPLLGGGCMYKIGGNLAAGFLDEAGGERRTDGVGGVTDDIVARGVITELGRQLGAGLSSGVGEITPEQRASLELTIESAMAVLTARGAKGIRDDLSPELRAMVQQDIVQTLSDGISGELGDSLQDTVDAVVTRAVESLVRGLEDEGTRVAIAELMRDSVYMAMREGRPGRESISEILEMTLTENMLDPLEHTVGGLAEAVADRVDRSAQRTENTLKAVISALVVIAGVLALMYAMSRRQLNRQAHRTEEATQEVRAIEAALGLLDAETRARILGKADEYAAVAGVQKEAPRPTDRSDDYVR